MQAYGLTGRRYSPNYVSMIEAERRYLPEKYRLREEKAYRDKSLRLAEDRLEAEKDAATKSQLIGLGNLGLSTYMGMKRDKGVRDLIENTGFGAGEATPSATPSAGTGKPGSFGPSSEYGPTATQEVGSNVFGSLKSNWLPIAGTAVAGGPIGGELAAKYFGDNTITRAIGGGVVAGGLGYLSTGDPYAAGISALFGGGLAALFG